MTQTDEKGRVLKQSELIAIDLKALIDGCREYGGTINETWLLKELTLYILQRIDDDHWPTLNQGRAIGLKEALAVMETVIGEDEIPRDGRVGIGHSVPTLTTDMKTRNALRAEQRERLSQAVAALTKGQKDE